MSWKEGEKALAYYENTQYKPVNTLVKRAAQLITQRPATALDLGCGAMVNVKHLLEIGMDVTAVDKEPLVAKYAPIGIDRFQLVITPFQNLHLRKSYYNLVTSTLALPFNPLEDVEKLVSQVSYAIKPGGYFSGSLLGDQDAWFGCDDMSFFTRSQTVNLLENVGLNVLIIEEKASDEPTHNGHPKKYWHWFDFLARKPSI